MTKKPLWIKQIDGFNNLYGSDGLRQLQQTFDRVSTLTSYFDRNSIRNTLMDVAAQVQFDKISNRDAMASISSALMQFSDNALSRLQVECLSSLQLQTMQLSAQAVQTEMITNFSSSLRALDIESCIGSVRYALKQPIVDAPDVGFIKLSLLGNFRDVKDVYPVGMLSRLNEINKLTAEQLIKSEGIQLIANMRSYVLNENYSYHITGSELNAICAALDALLAGISGTTNREKDYDEKEYCSDDFDCITVDDLMQLMEILETASTQVMESMCAQRVKNIIRNYNRRIGFDKEFYYHARTRKSCETPYPAEKMQRAPRRVAGAGRYNDPGQAHYYFADSVEGTRIEMMKHMSRDDKKIKVIQTVKLRPVCEIDLIDFSAKHLRKDSAFFRYLREPIDDLEDVLPRQYLIPNFVKDCCKDLGMEGIKYYGGADYSNYVSWEDNYLEPVGMCDDYSPLKAMEMI